MLLAPVLIGALVVAPTALAAAPDVAVIPIDFSFTPPALSAACGFPVTRDVQGTLTVRDFYKDGSFARELDQYRLVETLSANGRTLVGRTTQQIQVTMLADGSYTVAFMATDFRVPVEGAGVAFGSVGRLVLLFGSDDTLLAVSQDVGNVQGDYAALCGALSA
jgi:hypothetical protein